MLTEVILFSACLVLGGLSRLWYKALIFIESKMKNRPASIIFEFLSVGILTIAVLALVFFIGNGSITLYCFLGILIGFALASLFI